MPLQVVFSVYQKPAGVIVRFNAGEDLTNICGTSEILVATIIGNIEGHTFEWEQIFTDPEDEVTWTLPINPATVVEVEEDVYESATAYEYTGISKTDKVFRFWIDRGRPYEQYDEVIVYATPTSDLGYACVPIAKSSSPLTAVINALRLEETSIVTQYSIHPTFIDSQYGSQADCNATNYSINWVPPTTEFDKYLSVTLQLFNPTTGAWDNIVTHQIQDRQFNNLLPNRLYRLLFLVEIKSLNEPVRLTYTSSPLSTQQRASETIPIIHIASDLPYGTEQFIEITDYSVRRVVVRTYSVEDDLPYLPTHGTKSYLLIPSYSVIRRTVKTYSVEDGLPYLPTHGAMNYLRIPTYTVVDLGGGSIGG